MKQLLTCLIFIAIHILLDVYIIKCIRATPKKWRFLQKNWFYKTYRIGSICLIIGFLAGTYIFFIGVGIRSAFLLLFFLALLFKLSLSIFLASDDIRIWATKFSHPKKNKTASTPARTGGPPLPRSEFLLKAGLLAASVPMASIFLTMKDGLYDYHVKRQNLYLPNLPKAFDGLTIGQISDIHSGSFYNKKAVLGGVEMLMREKAELIFFTGDLVNSISAEMYGYQDIFSKVKAPLGVFSILGNHDYGDYGANTDWASPAAKKKNLDDLVTTHKNMGWDLMRNENRRLKIDGEEIGILGLENWGLYSRFPKYGRMDLTVKNTDDLPVRLLLSHDPSHWRAEVIPKYPQIDMTFAGHTHGMQFGVQTEHFKWSPVEYIYNEWEGLYSQDKQQLYVNVGYGFYQIPGRVGILPEITIFTLKAGTDPLTVKA
jgi:hypothetical protein